MLAVARACDTALGQTRGDVGDVLEVAPGDGQAGANNADGDLGVPVSRMVRKTQALAYYNRGKLTDGLSCSGRISEPGLTLVKPRVTRRSEDDGKEIIMKNERERKKLEAQTGARCIA
jgi:hypothetical protein